MANLALAFDILARDKGATATLNKVADSADRTGGKLSSLGGFAKGAGLALGGIAASGVVAFGGALVQGAKDAVSFQTLASKTGAVLKSTGNAAGTSVAGIQKLAGQLESLSGVDEELIINSQNVLATFTNIRNKGDKPIFDKAAKSALNMSVALGQDLQGATVMVGKALNDPIKGVTALSKAGVQFTTQQKDQIRWLVENGKAVKAQEIILGELETQFGGVAEAAGAGLQGDLARLQDAFGDAFRELGTALLPTLTTVAQWLSGQLPGAIEVGKQALGTLASFFESYVLPPLSAVADVVGAVVSAGFEAIGGWWDANGERVRSGFQTVSEAIAAVVTNGLEGVSNWWSTNGDTIKGGFDTLAGVIKDPLLPAIGSFFEMLRDDVLPKLESLYRFITENDYVLVGLATTAGVVVAGGFAAWAAAAASAAGATIAATTAAAVAAAPFALVAGAVGAVAAAFYWAWNESESFRFAVMRMGDYLSGAIELWKGLYEAIATAVDWLSKLIAKIDAIPGLPSWLSGAVDIVRGDGGGGGGNPLIDAARSSFGRFIPGFASGVRGFAGGLAVVGEGGPELLRLPAGSDVFSAGDTRAILGRGDTIVHVYEAARYDEDTLMRAVAARLA